MIGKFNSLECLELGCGLIPNVAPDAFAVAPEFDCTEELRIVTGKQIGRAHV